MGKSLIALIALAAAGCASTQPQYPAWLELKPGWAEACAQAGKCTPMTDAEMQEFAMQIAQRVSQTCSRRSL